MASRSIERQIPLVAALVVLGVSAALVAASYREMRQQSREAALARTAEATDRFAASLGDNARARRAQVEKAAASPSVLALLRSDTTARAAATAALDSMAPGVSSPHFIALWNRFGSALLVARVLGDTARWFHPPQPVEETSISPFIAVTDSILYYELVAPVRYRDVIIGWVQNRHLLHPDPNVEQATAILLGDESQVYVGTAGGIWTDLQRQTLAPPADVVAGSSMVHRRADGEVVISAGRAVPATPWTLVGQRTVRAATSTARGFLQRILLITAGIAVLGALMAWRLARGVTRPLVELTHAAEAIAGGNYSRRARVSRQNEIGRLGGAFNRMAEEIEARVRAMRASENRFRSLVTASAQIVWSTDADGNVVESLSTWQAFTGQSLEQMRGTGWVHAVHPDDREGALNAWKRALERRSSFVSEFRLRRHDGEYRWFVSRGVPVLETNGRIREWVGTCSDVTEHKQAEQRLRQKEEELRQSQKMEAVGRLAGGIAHDFNNLLTAILGPADMARDQIPADHPARRELDDIRTAALRASELTRQLLTFGRQQVVKSEPLDLNDIVRDSGRLLGRLLGEQIDLDISVAAEPCTLIADRSHIEQIVLNLAVNSRDAMPDGGHLTIETRYVELSREFADRHPNVRPGHYVLLAVSDTGRGMDAEILAHAFEPFFTTKEAGRGTGLGLATVYGIVHQSGGHVFAYSEVGKGTTFNIYLPRASEVRGPTAEPARTGSASTPARGGTETILLAEDDNAIRALTIRLLTRSGYKVIAADRGEVALDLAREHPGQIQLLVTDVVMPGMSGVDLWQHLREERPGCRVLFLSGWASDAIVRHGVIDSNTPFLQKPFTAESLIRSIRDVLDRA